MDLTDGEKAECKEIAREIVKEVLKEHIASCTYGKTLQASKWFIIGVVLACALVSGGSAVVFAKMLLAVP